MVCSLFDILIKPISLYGCEVLGVDQGAQVHDYLAEAHVPREAQVQDLAEAAPAPGEASTRSSHSVGTFKTDD